MSNFPDAAKKLGGEKLFETPISYGKSRIAGSLNFSYILHSKAGCMPGEPSKYIANSLTKPSLDSSILNNRITRAFQREQREKLHIPIGSNRHSQATSKFTYNQFSPHDDDVFLLTLKASYRQVYGNFLPMESERVIHSERRLRNGDLTVREFIRNLAKSDFYMENFFYKVSQARSINLSFKHLLGRPLLSDDEKIFHIKLIHDEGFFSHIDYLIDSEEYEEVFGSDTVPYVRCWESICGMKTSSFIEMAKLAQAFTASDNVIY